MTVKKKATPVPIVDIKETAQDTFQFTLSDPEIAANSHSGQFVNISIKDIPNLLWRRPLGIHQCDPEKGTFDILFKAIGRGTKAISQLKTGDMLDILGPLGNTFDYPEDLNEVIIVAGGLGIAPFILMLQDIADREIASTLFFGVKNSKELCCIEAFKSFNTDIHISTEDGSFGDKGLVTSSLEQYLSSLDTVKGKQMYVCGPTPMLKAVKEIAEKYHINAQVSMETIMACGFGACMGCPVPLENPTKEGKDYLLACKDGPVFNMKDIIINE